jgi:rare lipoprotein A
VTARIRTLAVTPSPEIARALRAGRSVPPTSASRVERVASDDLPLLTQPRLPPIVENRPYYIQIATFSNKDRAESLARAAGATVSAAGNLWRVRIGPLVGAKAVQRARDAVANRGYGDASILPAD